MPGIRLRRASAPAFPFRKTARLWQREITQKLPQAPHKHLIGRMRAIQDMESTRAPAPVRKIPPHDFPRKRLRKFQSSTLEERGNRPHCWRVDRIPP